MMVYALSRHDSFRATKGEVIEMRSRATALLAAFVLAALIPASAFALTPYTQDFETYSLPGVGLLLGDNWLVYGNVFAPDGTTYLYGYGPYPAPNDGAAFCAIAAGQGGVDQGVLQLSVYSDYNNQDHGLGRWIESNVYREQAVTSADVGQTWVFEFNAKMLHDREQRFLVGAAQALE